MKNKFPASCRVSSPVVMSTRCRWKWGWWRVPSQRGASWRVIEITLTFHYTISRHSRLPKTHLFAQRPSGIWGKVLWGRPHVNELCLTLHKVAVCIKLLLGDLSLCTLNDSPLSLSPSLTFPLSLAPSL